MRSPRFAGDDTHRYGGADRDRTGDLRRAKPALSRLSYSPKNFSSGKIFDSVHPKDLHLRIPRFFLVAQPNLKKIWWA